MLINKYTIKGLGCCLAVVTLMVVGTFASPVDRQKQLSLQKRAANDGIENRDFVVDHLSRFGYINKADYENKQVDQDKLIQALKSYQWFMGLKESGKFDEETKKSMEKPRCGVQDVGEEAGSYNLKWPNKRLTYKIGSYPSKFQSDDQKRAVEVQVAKAFRFWSAAAPLRFSQRKMGDVDLEVNFVKPGEKGGDHLSNIAVGHALFPKKGKLYLNDALDWHLDQSEGGLVLSQVISHELGHALGLSHSTNRSAVMFPQLGNKEKFKLHKNDRRAIRGLYGRHPAKTEAGGGSMPGNLMEAEKLLDGEESVESLFAGSLSDGDNDNGEGNSGDDDNNKAEPGDGEGGSGGGQATTEAPPKPGPGGDGGAGGSPGAPAPPPPKGPPTAAPGDGGAGGGGSFPPSGGFPGVGSAGGASLPNPPQGDYVPPSPGNFPTIGGTTNGFQPAGGYSNPNSEICIRLRLQYGQYPSWMQIPLPSFCY